MALTEAFAATAAQTIPVFALAAVIELRVGERLRSNVLPPDEPGRRPTLNYWALVPEAVNYMTWLALMIWLVNSEWTCLQVLSGTRVAESAATSVKASMLVAMLVLVILPLLNGPLLLWLNWYEKNNVWKRGQPPQRPTVTLDDSAVPPTELN